jgi:ABC-type polysaccharide/polyol phosphate export permease
MSRRVLAPRSTVPWQVNGPKLEGSAAAWAAVWRARDLVWFFALRDVRVRYKQAVLGVLWVIIQPIFSVVVFTLVFSKLAHLSSEGLPYPLFALVGTLVFAYFSAAVMTGSAVLVVNPSLVTKVAFPKMTAPAAAMLPPLVDVGVTLCLVVPLMIAYRVAPTWRLCALPVWLSLLVLTAFGFSLWFSALNVRYRDVQAALAPALQLWLFASPVAYSSSQVTGWPALVYSLNPVVGVIDLARWSLLGAPWPGGPLVVSVLAAFGVLVSGSVYFRRAERSFADVI